MLTQLLFTFLIPSMPGFPPEYLLNHLFVVMDSRICSSFSKLFSPVHSSFLVTVHADTSQYRHVSTKFASASTALQPSGYKYNYVAIALTMYQIIVVCMYMSAFVVLLACYLLFNGKEGIAMA